MGKHRYISFVVFLIMGAISVSSQDIHFSQFNASPQNLNPALSGFFTGKHRFVINHKSQWASITTPYQTSSASYDTRLLKRKARRKDMIGAGISFYRDIAGDSDFGTMQANLSVSYIKGLNNFNNHFLSFGVMLGGAQRNLKFDKLNFDNQFNGEYYDPNLSSGENLNSENFMYIDLGAGIHWFYQIKNRSNLSAGISAFHLNKPKQSHFDNSDIILNPRYLIHGKAQLELSHRIDLEPGFQVMNQGQYYEYLFGSMLKFILNEEAEKYTSINLGLYMRYNDAFIAVAGMDYKRFSAGISYDINYSDLKTASDLRGGFELSLIYILSEREGRQVKRKMYCPIF
jgi:type IX secretion system PorP/SprF family membrane protein